MKNWKEHANLFCNGKFFHNSDHGIRKIIGYERRKSFDVFLFEGGTWSVVEKCTLIARPISDMTIPEAHEAIELLNYDASADEYRQITSAHNKLDQTLYLLSIGVYPFNQGDFKTGKVISTLKE